MCRVAVWCNANGNEGTKPLWNCESLFLNPDWSVKLPALLSYHANNSIIDYLCCAAHLEHSKVMWNVAKKWYPGIFRQTGAICYASIFFKICAIILLITVLQNAKYFHSDHRQPLSALNTFVFLSHYLCSHILYFNTTDIITVVMQDRWPKMDKCSQFTSRL